MLKIQEVWLLSSPSNPDPTRAFCSGRLFPWLSLYFNSSGWLPCREPGCGPGATPSCDPQQSPKGILLSLLCLPLSLREAFQSRLPLFAELRGTAVMANPVREPQPAVCPPGREGGLACLTALPLSRVEKLQTFGIGSSHLWYAEDPGWEGAYNFPTTKSSFCACFIEDAIFQINGIHSWQF